MAINPDKLGEILAHSRQLCTPEADKIINEHKSNGNLKDVDPNNYHDKWDDWNYDDPISVNENRTSSMPSMDYDSRSIKNSAMKPEILKSMMEQRIDTRTRESAALDTLTENLSKSRKPLNENRKQQIVETVSVPASVGGGVDYNYLKYIVKECLNEYFSNNQLNESTGTLKQIGLSGGKIRLVDSKGNIYSANLELNGNIKDKKKAGN